jgi:vacuolar iron transporter family protein
VGAALPLLMAVVAPVRLVIPIVATCSLVCLAVLGALAAHAGGASRVRGAVRVTFWSAMALTLTALVGRVFGTSV